MPFSTTHSHQRKSGEGSGANSIRRRLFLPSALLAVCQGEIVREIERVLLLSILQLHQWYTRGVSAVKSHPPSFFPHFLPLSSYFLFTLRWSDRCNAACVQKSKKAPDSSLLSPFSMISHPPPLLVIAQSNPTSDHKEGEDDKN